MRNTPIDFLPQRKFHAPVGHLVGHTDPETGNVTWVITVTSKKVTSLTVPSGFYKSKSIQTVVGGFYERYIAYILWGTRSNNVNSQAPDVQLPMENMAHNLLFEVKSGHRTGGIVLKKNQLTTFAEYSNCLYAVVFHTSKDIRKRWKESRSSRKTIRHELEHEYSSIYIIPTELLVKYYEANAHREQPMPRYNGNNAEKFVSLIESHLHKLFEDYNGPFEKVSAGKIHMISDALILDEDQEQAPFIFAREWV